MGMIDSVLEKKGSFDMDMLHKVIFTLNTSPCQDGSGSHSSKYFARGVRTLLPNSSDREVSCRDLVKKHYDNQKKIYLQKGRTSGDEFRVGDKVLIK